MVYMYIPVPWILWGSDDLDHPGSIAPMQVVRMRGEGMPLRDDPASFGDLHVKAVVFALVRKQHSQIPPNFPKPLKHGILFFV